MSVYYMTSKTFLNDYLRKEDKDTIMDTQFVLVSTSIRTTGRYKKQIINGNNIFYPNQELIMDYSDWDENEYYKDGYMTQLNDNAKGLIATIVNYAIEHEDVNVVFMCTPREKKYAFFPILAEYIENKFGFIIYDYKKVIKGKQTEAPLKNREKVREKTKKVLKKLKKKKIENQLTTDKGKKDFVNELSKKELVKKLKKRNLYYDGMSKSEMKEMLETFI